MHLPSIRQLQYLLAVVELKHFGQAAERCFVTQSTLSAGIQELESLLGAQLLERSKRRVYPTPLGLELAEQARKILESSAHIVELAKGNKEPLTESLRLGVIPTIGPFLLPRILPELRQHFPKLELYLLEDKTTGLIERLAKGEIDAAILALPYDLGSLEYKSLWGEAFFAAFPSHHVLSGGGPILSTDIPPKELLLLEEGHCLREHALSACHRRGLPRRMAFQGTSLYTLIEMVAGGQGITLIPELAIDSSISNNENIRLRPLAESGPHREVALAWRSTYHRKNDLRLLGEYLTQLIKGRKSC